MEPADTFMFREASTASACVERQLRENAASVKKLGERLRALAPRTVFTCARGSSDHAATYAKYLIELNLGIPVASFAPSISSVYGKSCFAKDSVCLLISQSGASPDILSALSRANADGALTVALTNSPDSPLANAADWVLPLHAGPENSVAATKSYIASLSAIAHLTAEWSGNDTLRQAVTTVPDSLAKAWNLDWQDAVTTLTPATNMYVLGRGVGLGVAQEAALKFKECCGLHAECFSSAELIHGPMALVKSGFPVLIFTQRDQMLENLISVVRRCATQGATSLIVGTGMAECLPAVEGHSAVEPIFQIQSFYRMAVNLSIARGYNPDSPPHLLKVTQTL